MNNTRQRWLWRHRDLTMLPSGTTGNEAFHSHIGNMMRQVRKLDQTSLDIKLGLIKFGSHLAHTTAHRFPTMRQIGRRQILVP